VKTLIHRLEAYATLVVFNLPNSSAVPSIARRNGFAHGLDGCFGVTGIGHFYKGISKRTIGFLVDDDSNFAYLAK
jgi:hypothetical protein